MRFGKHNRYFAFDERGNLQDPAPWFLKTGAQKGHAHQTGDARLISPDEWTRVKLEVGDCAQRLFVNGELRHSWE